MRRKYYVHLESIDAANQLPLSVPYLLVLEDLDIGFSSANVYFSLLVMDHNVNIDIDQLR